MNDYLTAPVYRYHSATKHTVERLLNSRKRLDWANQPSPFRTYSGAKIISLPRPVVRTRSNFFDIKEICDGNQTAIDATSLDLQSVSTLLFYSFAISAWKQIRGTDHKWALRVNPSSGNLHPTECHLFFGESSTGSVPAARAELRGGHHYNVFEHQLERRTDSDIRAQILDNLCSPPESLPDIVIVLTSIFWRESWKYEQRAYRYCLLDMGHALASLRLSCAALGWSSTVYGEFNDGGMKELLSLTDEQPLAVIAINTGTGLEPYSQSTNRTLAAALLGEANTLSTVEINYREIAQAHESTCQINSTSDASFVHARSADFVRSGRAEGSIESPSGSPYSHNADSSLAPFPLIARSRRSAVDMDGQRRMAFDHLSRILSSLRILFPSDFACGDANALVVPFIYINRVDGLSAGLYAYDAKTDSLLLHQKGDVRNAAKYGSCFQDIASDGCFAVSMLADLRSALKAWGDRGYRYMHFHAGYLGQLLYLAGQTLGYDSTGIGCFVDDEINKFVNAPEGVEVIYNFTTGEAVFDPRLTDLPAYPFAEPV